MKAIVLDMKRLEIVVLGDGDRRLHTINVKSCDTSAQVLHRLLVLVRQPWCKPGDLEKVLGVLEEAFARAWGKGMEQTLCPRGSSNLVRWHEYVRSRRRPVRRSIFDED